MLEIRDEQPADSDAVREVNRRAFAREHEGRLVEALRDDGAVVLSLVAIADGAPVGHILFSPVTVGAQVGAALGPMAVSPAYQRQGIGSRLVAQGLEGLRAKGCPFVVVLGHPKFYPRFGFVPAVTQGLTCAWEVPDEVFMVKILDPEADGRLRGRAQYRSEFAAFE